MKTGECPGASIEVPGHSPVFLFYSKIKREEVLPVGDYTRIYERFKWWSVADCSCEFCVHFRGKKRSCPLDVCCVEDIRQEAVRREQAAAGGATARLEAVPCRG